MPLRLGKDLRNIIAPLANDPLIPLSGFGLDATHFDSVLRSEGNGYNLFEIYQEIERDCHAFAVLQSRKLDVSRREWEIRPYQQKNASIRRKDQKTADMITDMLLNMGGGLEELDGQALVQSGESGFDTWAHAALNALLYGFSGSEIAWTGTREVYPERIIYRKPHRFKFALVPEGYLPKLRVRAQLDIPLPPRKFIFHYHQPENGPFGLGLGHRLFWPVFFKREDVKQWLLFSEKYASPTIAVSHPTNATSAEIGEALETAEAMSSQVAIAVPEEFKYELLEAQRSGSINAYKDLADWCDDQISKAVLGQTGTTDQSSGGGSRARDEVAERVSLRLAKHDADCLANTVNSTLIRWIMRFNGGQQTDLPQLWWLFPELEQREDLTARAAIDKTLWDMEFIPTREYIEETYEIELEEEPTEELGPDGQPIPSASDQLEQLFGGGVVPAGAPAAPAEVAAPVEPAPTLSEMEPLDALEYLMMPVDFAAKKKGGKKAGAKKKKCTKGKVCGGSCIAKDKRCKTDPPTPAAGAAAKALTNTDPFGPETNPLPAQPAKPTPAPKPPVQQQPDLTPEPVATPEPVRAAPAPQPAARPADTAPTVDVPPTLKGDPSWNPYAKPDMAPQEFRDYIVDKYKQAAQNRPTEVHNQSFEQYKEANPRGTKGDYRSDVISSIDAGLVPSDAAISAVKLTKAQQKQVETNRANLESRTQRIAEMERAINAPLMSESDTAGWSPTLSKEQASQYLNDSYFGTTNFYHGNPTSVTDSIANEGAKPWLNEAGIYGQGTYFAVDKRTAETYAAHGAGASALASTQGVDAIQDGSPFVKDAGLVTSHIKAKNPYIATRAEFDEISSNFTGTQSNGSDSAAVTAYLKAKGYDSVYLSDVGFGVAFEQKQVVTVDNQRVTADQLKATVARENDMTLGRGLNTEVTYASENPTVQSFATQAERTDQTDYTAEWDAIDYLSIEYGGWDNQ
jgi:phage gp29-like protein